MEKTNHNQVQKRNNPEKTKKNHTNLITYAKYSGIAFQIGAIIGLFTWGGYKLDEWLQTSFPIFLAIGLFLGLFLGVYTSIKDFLKK